MNNEKPISSRETFDKNEADIAQTKQAIAEAVAAGDYDKLAELAQQAKGMETVKGEMVGDAQSEASEDNKAIDEAKAAQEKGERDAQLAEQARLQAEKDKQEAARLLEKLMGGNAGGGERVSEAPQDLESLKKTNMESLMEAQRERKVLRGEAQFALAEKKLPEFQRIYSKLIETIIREDELEIADLDMDFEGGNFQGRGPSTSPEVKGAYEYQKKSKLEHIKQLQERVLYSEQEISKGRVAPNDEGFQSALSARRPEYVLTNLMAPAEMFQNLEETSAKEAAKVSGQGTTYGEYTAELEGAVTAALGSRDVHVVETLKNIARKIKKLPPELKQKIEKLS